MSLPFTVEQFLVVFATYNTAIWPAQIAAYAFGLVAVGALWRESMIGKRFILFILAGMWAWNGIAYHFGFFATINPMAKGVSVIFVLQAILLAASAVATNNLQFKIRLDLRSALGLGFMLYALLIYELLGYAAGHGLMKGPLFGVAPCPTTIFTIGMLLLAQGTSVGWLAIIPIVWSLIGASAAVLLGVPEDFGLAVAAVTLLIVLVRGHYQRQGLRSGRAGDIMRYHGQLRCAPPFLSASMNGACDGSSVSSNDSRTNAPFERADSGLGQGAGDDRGGMSERTGSDQHRAIVGHGEATGRDDGGAEGPSAHLREFFCIT
jgi:Family of unknown function (DUF6064)